jgi:hypothetical protein
MLSLQARFQTEEYTQSSLSKTINEVVVEYTPTAEIVRPKPDHVYDSMPGMKKTFLFMPVREGVTLIRRFGCWCTACMHSWAPGWTLPSSARNATAPRSYRGRRGASAAQMRRASAMHVNAHSTRHESSPNSSKLTLKKATCPSGLLYKIVAKMMLISTRETNVTNSYCCMLAYL